MTEIHAPLSTDAQKVTTAALQRCLVDVVDLSLAAKQVHWNIVGPHFRSIHLQLDELVAAARDHSDVIAERLVAIGGHADGRAETLVAERSGDPLPEGQIRDLDGAAMIVRMLSASVKQMREQMHAVEEADPTSQDLLNAMLHDLEKQLWMFQAIAA